MTERNDIDGDMQGTEPADNLDADAALIDALRGEAYVRKSNLIEQAADRLEALTAREAWLEARIDEMADELIQSGERAVKAEATLAKVLKWLDTHKSANFARLQELRLMILDGNGGDTE